MQAWRNVRHHQVVVPCAPDRLAILRRLARPGLFDGYVAYGSAEKLTFAAGRLAEIKVDAAGVAQLLGGRRSSEPLEEHPFRQVGRLLDTLAFPQWRAYGYVAFEAARLGAVTAPHLPDGGPLLHLVVPETEVTITATGVRVDSVSAAAVAQVGALISDSASLPAYTATPFALGDEGCCAYMESVAAVVEAIRHRRVQKVILSRKVPLPFAVDLVGTYILGSAWNNPARSFLVDLDGRRAAGFSPETVLEVRPDGWVRTQPLAGTRPCGRGDEEDERLRQELLWDPKEGYEHAISAKLAYEEMLAVCTPESVGVGDFMTVKRRGPVQHLSSEVTGQLAAGRDRWDALDALFPAVTASGIPKRDAYAYIAAHESGPRGMYAGAVCAIDSDGSLDAALVLRAVFEEHGRAWLQAGAGIVGTSDPAAEYRETHHKLQSVARVLVRADARVGGDPTATSVSDSRPVRIRPLSAKDTL